MYSVFRILAPVVLTLDSAIPRINHYPADKYYGNQLRSPLDSDLSGGLRYPTFEQPRPAKIAKKKLWRLGLPEEFCFSDIFFTTLQDHFVYE